MKDQWRKSAPSPLQEKTRRQIKMRLAAMGRRASHLADALGYTSSWISMVLSGKRGVSVDALEKIAQYFEIDVQVLVGELPPVGAVTEKRDDNSWLRQRIAQLEHELAIAIADRNYARQLFALAETRRGEDA